MNELDRLIAIEKIKNLKARYFRAFDTKDYGQFVTVFTPDATFDMRQAMSSPDAAPASDEADAMLFVGRENISAFAGSTLVSWSAHHGHNPEIDVTSETSATGIWALADAVAFPEGGPVKGMRGFGYYHDTYSCLDGQWLIASTRLIRVHLEFS